MNAFQLILGVVAFGLFWLLFRYLIDHKNSVIKTEAEKIKLRKQSNWSIALGLFAYFGVVFLMNSKTTGWQPWFIAGGYILVWATGGYLVWRAYRILIKNDITKVKKHNGLVINHPQKFSRSFAVSDLLFGLSIWIFAIAILAFKIDLAIWGAFFVIISGLRIVVVEMLEKADENKT